LKKNKNGQIELEQEELEILDGIKEKLGLSSRTETISHILKLMKQGREFQDVQNPPSDEVKDV